MMIYSSLASDPDLREIVQLFVDEMPGRILVIETEFAAERWTELMRAAHQLKGAAGSHGFAELSTNAAVLESAVKSNAGKEEIVTAMTNLIILCRQVTAAPAPC